MAEGLIATLVEQLRKNLGDTLSAFGAGDVNWSSVAAYVIGQVLVSLVYLVLFVGSWLKTCSRYCYSPLPRSPYWPSLASTLYRLSLALALWVLRWVLPRNPRCLISLPVLPC